MTDGLLRGPVVALLLFASPGRSPGGVEASLAFGSKLGD
jgi:hypothetical protein